MGIFSHSTVVILHSQNIEIAIGKIYHLSQKETLNSVTSLELFPFIAISSVEKAMRTSQRRQNSDHTKLRIIVYLKFLLLQILIFADIGYNKFVGEQAVYKYVIGVTLLVFELEERLFKKVE